MNPVRLLIATVTGGVVLILLLVLMAKLGLAAFIAANSAPGILRATPVAWAPLLGHLAQAALVAFAIVWSRSYSILGGLKIGAIVGFLLWFAVDLNHYGFMNRMTLTLALIDPIIEAARTGIAGAVMASILGRGSKA